MQIPSIMVAMDEAINNSGRLSHGTAANSQDRLPRRNIPAGAQLSGQLHNFSNEQCDVLLGMPHRERQIASIQPHVFGERLTLTDVLFFSVVCTVCSLYRTIEPTSFSRQLSLRALHCIVRCTSSFTHLHLPFRPAQLEF